LIPQISRKKKGRGSRAQGYPFSFSCSHPKRRKSKEIDQTIFSSSWRRKSIIFHFSFQNLFTIQRNPIKGKNLLNKDLFHFSLGGSQNKIY